MKICKTSINSKSKASRTINYALFILHNFLPIYICSALYIPTEPQLEVQWFYDEILEKHEPDRIQSLSVPTFIKDPAKDDRFPAYNLIIDDQGGIVSAAVDYLPDTSWEEPIMSSLRSMSLSPGVFSEKYTQTFGKIYFTDYFYVSSKHDGEVILPKAKWILDMEMLNRFKMLGLVDGKNGYFTIVFRVDEKGNTTRVTSNSDVGEVIARNYLRPNIEQFTFTPLIEEGEPTECRLIWRFGKFGRFREAYREDTQIEFLKFAEKPLPHVSDDLIGRDYPFLLKWTPSGRVEHAVPIGESTPVVISNSTFANLRHWQSGSFAKQKNDGDYYEIINVHLDTEKNLRIKSTERNLYRFKRPVRLRGNRPEYPPSERKRGLQGVVTMIITIDENGDVSEYDVKGTSGDAFTYEAVKVVKTLKYEPAKINDRPIKMKFVLPISFILD